MRQIIQIQAFEIDRDDGICYFVVINVVDINRDQWNATDSLDIQISRSTS